MVFEGDQENISYVASSIITSETESFILGSELTLEESLLKIQYLNSLEVCDIPQASMKDETEIHGQEIFSFWENNKRGGSPFSDKIIELLRKEEASAVSIVSKYEEDRSSIYTCATPSFSPDPPSNLDQWYSKSSFSDQNVLAPKTLEKSMIAGSDHLDDTEKRQFPSYKDISQRPRDTLPIIIAPEHDVKLIDWQTVNPIQPRPLRAANNFFDNYDENYNSPEPRLFKSARKLALRRPRFSKVACCILTEWFSQNAHHPYPKEAEKLELMGKTGLTKDQIDNWFVNTRRRGLPKRVNQLEMQV